MATAQDFELYTSTPKRRHTFFCYCTQEFVQDQAVFFVLVQAFRAKRSKRQGLLLKDWFVEGNIPDELTEGGFLTQVNVADTVRRKISADVDQEIRRIGLTFSDKMRNNGGRVKGFFKAVGQKFGDTGLAADSFDAAIGGVVSMLDETGKHGFKTMTNAGRYDPDGTYQKKAFFVPQIAPFRRYLKDAGFNPDDLGFY